jgi:3D (Asp-Asp-Asp) domain-containing protein/peptidoglycan hydrolase CwlO-like protein
VLGQAHTPKRRVLPLVLLALGVLVAPAVGGAGRSPSQASLRAQDARIVAESRASALSLYSLDQRLASAQARLGTLASQANTLRTERIELRHELAIARSSTRLASQRLDARLRALYEQGDVEPLEIVFGATSLDEALSALDTLSRASSQGRDVLLQLQGARTRLHDASRSLSARTAALATALGEARATARSLEAARATRSAYIDSLAAKRRLTEQQLSALEAEVRVADIRTASLDVPPASPSGSAPELSSVPPVAAGARSITVSATGYSLSGSTATGLPVGWGVAAVDPSVIPLGAHLTVPGYGEAIAADTGGAVVGTTIDLWFPTAAEAMAWGRRIVTISLH